MYYVGHDGHKDNSVFCITTSSGNVKETFETTATPEGMDVLILTSTDAPYKRVCLRTS